MPHTKGTWRVSAHEDNNDIVIRNDHDDILANLWVDASLGMTRGEAEANAVLMAKAPVILSALEGCVDWITHNHDGYPVCLIEALQVIKQARGLS